MTSCNSLQQVSILSLPNELLALILDSALVGTRHFQRTRHLSNYSLIHPQFTAIAQRRLFSITQVTGEPQARAFSQLTEREPRLAAEVRELVVHGEADNGIGRWMSQIMKACPKLKEVTAVMAEIGTDVLPEITTQACTLRLTSIFLHVPSTTSVFSTLTQLTLHNMYLTNASSFPTFPALQSLTYHFDNDPYLPSLQIFPLDGLFHTGTHLKHLEVGRWESVTLKSDPKDLDGEKNKTSETNLDSFKVLKSLCLLADSSHRARSYFPLLKTSRHLPLTRFEVKVDLGYRDKLQEVDAMAIELQGHFTSEESSFKELEKLLLPKVFQGYKELPSMKDLEHEAKKKGTRIAYLLG